MRRALALALTLGSVAALAIGNLIPATEYSERTTVGPTHLSLWLRCSRVTP